MKQQHKTYPLEGLNPLIIGRGPVRLEAMQIFAGLNVKKMGIILSRQDACAYPYAQAPELKLLPKSCQVHLVEDYMPASGQSIADFIRHILQICQTHGYRSVFAGYGFLSENPQLSRAVQQAGLYFIGPSAHVSEKAGAKDKAKITAAEVGASSVPGENTLLGLASMMQNMNIDDFLYFSHELQILKRWQQTHQGFEGFTFAQVLQTLQKQVEEGLNRNQQLVDNRWIMDAASYTFERLWKQYPGYSIRIKAIFGGGGKGQRVLKPGSSRDDIRQALESIWIETGSTGQFSNKNCVIELNIESIRHWEIQLIGNGRWCLALGGRDCSIQRHEQKLIEFSLNEATLKGSDLKVLQALQKDAVAFGSAVGLDSVATYEAIVNIKDQQHFFMEMNTRLQVEHRVSELMYGLRFNIEGQTMYVDHLIHVMALLAVYGQHLPEPELVPRHSHSLEVRINAMNNALKPAPGGLIQFWSKASINEIRDDQGISGANPDSGYPAPYFISGAYDSNLALSLVTGISLENACGRMLDILTQMRVSGRHLELNIEPLLGMLSVMHAVCTDNAQVRFATSWTGQYLILAAQVQLMLKDLQLDQLNPHRVIAWILTGNAALLWARPGQVDPQSLKKLQQSCDEFDIKTRIRPDIFAALTIVPSAEQILDPPVLQQDGLILSPQSGLYYARSAPGEPAFIVKGQRLKKGDTLCIIEAMKMFNTIKAPCDMIIEDLCFENGVAVQKGDKICTFSHDFD